MLNTALMMVPIANLAVTCGCPVETLPALLEAFLQDHSSTPVNAANEIAVIRWLLTEPWKDLDSRTD